MVGESFASGTHGAAPLWLIDQVFSMNPAMAHTIVAPGFFADAYLLPIGMAVHLGVCLGCLATAEPRHPPMRISPE